MLGLSRGLRKVQLRIGLEKGLGLGGGSEMHACLDPRCRERSCGPRDGTE